MAQQKLALKAMRTEEDFKTQTQLLAAQLNQKEQALVELREAKSTSASAMQEKLTVLRADNVHTTSALESLQQSTTQLQADLSRCNEQLTQKTDELAAKSHDLTEKTRELDKSKSEYDKAVQYSAEEKIELALESVRRITALEEQVKAQKKTAKDMKEMLENAENDMLELKESKQSVAAQLRARCDGLERGLDIMTSESSSASQEMSQLRKKMQESYVLAQREKNELTDQLKLMEDRLKRLRLEAEDDEKNLKTELREREAENKGLASSLHEQTLMNKTIAEGTTRLQESMRAHLTKLRGDLDSSHLLDGSLLDSSAVATDSPEKTAPSPYNRSILSKSMKEPQDEGTALLDDFGSEIERIKAAIHNAETQNAQLLAKVSSLDLSLAEHKTLNHSLLQQTQSLKIHEADNAKYKDKVHKLEERVEKVKKMAHEEMKRRLMERDKAMVLLEEEVTRLITAETDLETSNKQLKLIETHLKEQTSESTAQLARAQEAINELRAELAQAQEAGAEKEECNAALAADYRAQINELKAELAREQEA
eukprot:CAMPEP_0179465326 /NCGR_PEP_ID=MMETSP0799-20121207/46912_1 /TAXON_ID=46947 /ORGANISM="Geminigera cryophila, Strain CCMP2564" /LENGTH=539 /DNA_ID=CAMNT_0021269537 /DNA_START=9 /DNA_END=1624 /DNA_ORIENTATION=-